MDPYTQNLSAEHEDGRHARPFSHSLDDQAESGNPHLQSTSSLFLKLDTAYNGLVIPPDCDRSAFAPHSLNPDDAQALSETANPRTAVRSDQRGYPGRTLVLCFDGTGDQFDLDNSNVVNFFSVLRKGDNTRQLVYYQSGIGTYTIPQVATPLYAKTSKLLDLMFANSINHHVMNGYKFLMQEYELGDKICIFGFSRGAYTARALAGMINKVGLLPTGNEQQVPFAYKMFTDDSKLGWDQSAAFKKTFSLDVDIAFVGVWDTVASVGIFPTTLPFTQSNTAIKVFRHALALDEHRVKFKPSLYQQISDNKYDFKKPEGKIIDKQAEIWSYLKETARRLGSPREERRDREEEEERQGGRSERNRLEAMYHDRSRPTDVKEVWFAGAHGDVGGGCVKNGAKASLARIPLRWMIRECFRMNTGIQFEADKLSSLGLEPTCLWPQVLENTSEAPYGSNEEGRSRLTPSTVNLTMESPPSTSAHLSPSDVGPEPAATLLPRNAPSDLEKDPNHDDARSSSNDQLHCAPWWWILEYLPMQERVQCEYGRWRKCWTLNRGRPRELPAACASGQKELHVHRSVSVRMKECLYQPRVKIFSPGVKVVWVD